MIFQLRLMWLQLIHSVETTHQTSLPKTYCIVRKNRKHRPLDTKYNFILYLILHCTQLHFNYIPTVSQLQHDFNNFKNLNTTVVTTRGNSKLKHSSVRLAADGK